VIADGAARPERGDGMAAEAGRELGGSRAVPILMYHQVSAAPMRAFARYTVTSRTFAAQMRWLSLAGYEPITLDRLLEHRRTGAVLPSRPVVITFDDGFRDLVHHAVPVLSRHGFTATFFLVAGLMGRMGRWLREEIGTEMPLMNWTEARELEAAGFQCGAHTMTHPRLAALPAAACAAELAESRSRLENELGHEVRHLAYPFGSFDMRVREIAADAGYASGCSTAPGLSRAGDDPLALPRITVYGHESLLSFGCRLRTALPLRELVRRRLRPLLRRSGR